MRVPILRSATAAEATTVRAAHRCRGTGESRGWELPVDGLRWPDGPACLIGLVSFGVAHVQEASVRRFCSIFSSPSAAFFRAFCVSRRPPPLSSPALRRLVGGRRRRRSNPGDKDFISLFAGDEHPSGTMINLFKIKDQKKDAAANTNGKPAVKKQSPGELRLHKDIAELNLPKTTRITFPNGKDDLMNFESTIKPDEGYYMGGKFVFTFQVPPAYPHEPPKVKCKTKVYHPNIDLEGNVCLNILREDWKPVLNINTIVYGLNLLFSQPNDEDPLNHDAAAVLRDDPKKFEKNVQRAMAGGYVGETHFPRCI